MKSIENTMKINKAWHEAHPMPKNPTIEERLAWHIAHYKACKCREQLPESIKKEVKKRKIKL